MSMTFCVFELWYRDSHHKLEQLREGGPEEFPANKILCGGWHTINNDADAGLFISNIWQFISISFCSYKHWRHDPAPSTVPWSELKVSTVVFTIALLVELIYEDPSINRPFNTFSSQTLVCKDLHWFLFIFNNQQPVPWNSLDTSIKCVSEGW